MLAITLNLPGYPELGFVTLNLHSGLLTKCDLAPQSTGKQLQKHAMGRD